MKKLLLMFSMIFVLAGCSEEKFDSYEKADDYLLKAVYNGELDYKKFTDKIASENHEVSEEEFQKLQKIAEVHLKDGTTKITREDNATMIYDKSSNSDYADVVISWVFEDDTFKVDDIIVAKTY